MIRIHEVTRRFGGVTALDGVNLDISYGVRLHPYRFTDAELHGALAELLGGTRLRRILTEASATIRARDGLRTAADLIEQCGRGLHAGRGAVGGPVRH